MNCPSCDSYNQTIANFCSNCGTRLPAPEDTEREDGDTVQGEPQPPPEAGLDLSLQTSTEYAGLGIRAAAYLIDLLLVNIMAVFILVAVDPTGYLVYAAAISYWVLFTGLRGQTPGKMVMGLHVIRSGGLVPGIGPALARETLGRFLSVLSLGLGYAWASWDPRRQGWHDKLAGTYVVRTRTGIFTPPREP